MLSRISKFAVGAALIPVVIGVTISLFETLTDMNVGPDGSKIFLWGIVAYVILHLFLYKPTYIYTLGHELIHALSTWLCGGKVVSFRVSQEGGQVQTTKSNFFISLSPYFVPIYTIIVSLLYFLLPLVIKIPNLKTTYFFSMGFTLALHLVFTADVMKREQPDITKTGYLFSLVLIYVMNIFMVTFLISIFFKGVSFEAFFYNAYLESKTIYIRLFKQLFML